MLPNDMGFFDQFQKKGSVAIQPQRPQIRKVEAKPPPSASSTPKNANSRRPPQTPQARPSNAKSSSKSRDSARLQPRSSSQRLGTPSNPNSRKRPSPALRLSSDDESDTDEIPDFRKRAKVSASAEPDLGRQIRSKKAFSEDGRKSFPMVHAADITSAKKAGKFSGAFDESTKPVEMELQYPSASQKERYQLVVPRDNDDFKPLDDIVQVVEMVSQNYIPESEEDIFNNDSTGLKRKLRRALTRASQADFEEALSAYNKTIDRLRREGIIAKHLDQMHSLNLPLVERILTQIYSRTVSPRVSSLRQYENGSDNVYGELLPRFISEIFKETRLKSDQIFVDLGSGVGNVVMQAALEVGCQSWGCEMMQNAADLAELQKAEFKARCRLWGLSSGAVHLRRGDFLEEKSIIETLQKADVVLINNKAFTPELNDKLSNHFLDMKEGCQIVSLKSFAPTGHKIQSRNAHSHLNLLSVKEKNYWSDSVSWTDAGGTYYIATKDSSKLQSYMEKEL
ncbi:Nucleosomal histone H3-Lys79 methylase [Arachnomyces sp. PD_36]|nr:Nucleosomal histone H3-Lys79 methylase [Arachnomyces sp. PD_36]